MLRPRIGRTSARLLSRTLSSGTVSYYDSQSGLHVSYSNDLKVHGILPQESVAQDWYLPVKGLSSITLPQGTCISDFSERRWDVAPEHVFTGAENPAMTSRAVSIDLHVTSLRGEWDKAINMCATANEAGANVKINLLGAHDVDPGKVALAACLSADAGAEVIMLDILQSEDVEEELCELWEEIVGCDIVGLPMKNRAGLRLRCEDGCCDEEITEQVLVSAATELGIRHMDVSLSDDPFSVAISYKTLDRILKWAEVGYPLEIVR